MSSWFLILSSFVFSVNAHAAACCGGGFAAPSLIAGDDAGQLTASYAYTQVVDEVGSDSLWRRVHGTETNGTWKIDGAHIFADRWQAGVSLPLVQRSRAGEGSFGLGDAAATLGFEALPDWDYNPWRPKGITFLQLTAPTGRSVDESTALYQLDSRGRGFWALGAGALFTKAYGAWDFFSELDGHRSFAKDYANSESAGRLFPGWGGNAGGGAGYNLRSVRFGGSLTYAYEDPVNVSGTANSRGAPQRFATAAATVSWLASLDWAVTTTYADQTLFGSPVNTSLGRGATLLVQRRWQR
jgi:hypothetical protein